MFDESICSEPPADTTTDAGVAGAGVLLSFIITAGTAILLSTIIIFYEVRGQSKAKLPRRLLQSFSDQQIIVGIGIQSVGLAKMNSMVPYHFFIIWMLSLLSTATHLSSLLALVGDFKRDWVLRWLRQSLMFINLVLSCAYGIMILMVVMKGLPDTLPVACAWHVEKTNSPTANAALSIAGTIAVMAGNSILFALAVWYMHTNHRWIKWIQVIGVLVLVASGVGAAVKVVLASQAFGTPSVKLVGMSENSWNFGQLLSMLMLLLPLVSAIEIIRGEMRLAPPVPCDGSYPSKEDHAFQPNPFWGSNTELVRR